MVLHGIKRLFIGNSARKNAERINAVDRFIAETRAKEIIAKYGKSSLDPFKVWEDKSYYFSKTKESFIAYRIEADYALVLGDPVGPDFEIKVIIKEFETLCKESKLKLAFFQTEANHLEIYDQLGFKKIKMGDEGIADINSYELKGKKGRKIRNRIKKFEKLNVSIQIHNQPSDELMQEIQAISNEWLKIPGKKERSFSLGHFDYDYVKSTTVITANNENGKVIAFLNLLPSGKKGEMIVDLMRRKLSAPSGIMDYLFIKLFLESAESEIKRINIGLAPMSGFSKDEEPSLEEIAIHGLFQNLNFIFSYKGLREYKDKYANIWEPRYLIFKNHLQLPSLALVINKTFS